MTKLEITTLLLSSALVSGVVTTALTYFFDILKNKSARNFEIKQGAYMKAIASISGISHTTFDYFIKKHSIDNRINPLVVTEFVAAHTRELAPAILVAGEEIQTASKELAPLIIEGANIIEKLNATAKKVEGGYITAEGSDEILLDWRTRIEAVESRLIRAMKQDLGLR